MIAGIIASGLPASMPRNAGGLVKKLTGPATPKKQMPMAMEPVREMVTQCRVLTDALAFGPPKRMLPYFLLNSTKMQITLVSTPHRM